MRKDNLFVVVCLLFGCGESSSTTARLAGIVMIKGVPVPADASDSLSFVPGKGGEALAVPIVDGRYDSPETPLGKVTVRFSISRPVGPEKVSERTGEKYREIANLVPPEHSAGMVIEVEEDNSNRNFDL